jgi:hypothetical protein
MAPAGDALRSRLHDTPLQLNAQDPAETDALRQQVRCARRRQTLAFACCSCTIGNTGCVASSRERTHRLRHWSRTSSFVAGVVQVSTLQQAAAASQAHVHQAEDARRAAEQQAERLRAHLHASQERMAVLKEQLMSGQEAAEESEQRVVQDAVHRVEAELGERLRQAQHEVRCA